MRTSAVHVLYASLQMYISVSESLALPYNVCMYCNFHIVKKIFIFAQSDENVLSENNLLVQRIKGAHLKLAKIILLHNNF